jgi:WD40 repeat protein
VWAVAVGRLGDRDVIVSGSTDASVRVWDAATGTPSFVQDTIDDVRAVTLAGNLLAFSTGTAVCAITLS